MSDPEASLEGIGSLIRVAGINIPARARFVGETVISATLSSLTFGLVCGQVGAMTTIGPLAPFLCGSWFGYSAGLLRQWWDCKRLAKRYASRYPTLMLYSLQQDWNTVVPESVTKNEDSLEEWITDGGLGRTTMSILAAQSIKTSVEEIQQRGREKVAGQYNSD